MQSGIQRLGDAVTARYARSFWRFPLLLGAALVAFLVPLYLVRGMRLVRLGVAAAAALAFAALGFARPFQTLLFGLFLAFAGLGHYLPGSIVAAVLALAASRALYDLLGPARFDAGSLGFRFAFAVLLASACSSLLVVHNWAHATEQLQLLALGSLVYFALSQLADRPDRIAAVVVAVSAGVALGTLLVVRGLIAAGGLGLLELATGARFGGIRGDPNVQAMYANCLIAPLVALLPRARTALGRGALLLLLLLMIATVILSQSRAGMLLLGILLFLLVLREKRARPFAVVGLLVLATTALLLPRVYWVRFVSIAQLGGIVVDRSLQLRQHALEGGWDLFLEHPWLGVGLGNFRDHAPRFMLGGFMAHNSFLEIAASLGVVGVAAYMAWLWTGMGMAADAATVWDRAGRRWDRALASSIRVALVVFVLSALTLSVPFYPMLWLLLGLANAARRVASSAAAGSPSPTGAVPDGRAGRFSA